MEQERRDAPPKPVLLPHKAKRRRKKDHGNGDTVIIQIDMLSPPVVHERRAVDAPVGAEITTHQQVVHGAKLKDVVLIGAVAVVALVLGTSIFKPEAMKTATEFVAAIGRLATTLVTKS
jgi:hypothetical protein